MRWIVERSVLSGSSRVPGDKSIAHRALMIAAIADGASEVDGLPAGADVMATAGCLRSLGSQIEVDDGMARIRGGVLEVPTMQLDAANSGTTMRLLAGLLSGTSFTSTLTGDESLRRRPMRRVIEPLERMGASIDSDSGYAPLRIDGRPLRSIQYKLPVASAQVKSAILLAGLQAQGCTSVIEPVPTRDHTERLLRHTGVAVRIPGQSHVEIEGGQRPRPFSLQVPGDQSSAAFLCAAAAMLDGRIEVRDVGVNPRRTGFLDVLRAMGSTVEFGNEHESGGEPVADIVVSGRPHRSVTIQAADVPAMIDELPLVALLGTAVSGDTVVSGAAELRVKESDRIDAVVRQLTRLGANIEERADGFVVHGPTALLGTSVDSGGDHRMAMLLAVAGLAAGGVTTVNGVEAATVSFPGFAATIRALGGSVAVS